MASQRRGGPDVKGTLGTLLRTTMHQVGVVKDAAYRQARTQRVWIDSAVLARRRRELLADIGEQVVARLREGGDGELARWPELAARLDELDALEADLDDASARSREAVPAVSAVSALAGRPRPERDREAPARRPEDLRVWRPDVSGAQSDAEPPAPARGDRRKERLGPAGEGGISFSSGADLDDDDLEAYMHEDDVPEER